VGYLFDMCDNILIVYTDLLYTCIHPNTPATFATFLDLWNTSPCGHRLLMHSCASADNTAWKKIHLPSINNLQTYTYNKYIFNG
jgi:hypothetical protein